MWLLRMIGIGLAILLAVGFGLCGVMGVTTYAGGALKGDVGSILFLLLGLAGLGIAWVFVGIVRLDLKDKPDADRPPEH